MTAPYAPAGLPSRRAGGFTLIELTIVVAIAAAGLSTLPALWGITDELTTESAATTRAEAEHRRDVQAVANLLRGVPADTIGGLDAGGRSAAPTFRRIVDLSEGGAVVLGSEESLAWTAQTGTRRAPDGRRLGELAHVQGMQRTLLARHVPEGAFALTVTGRAATITLTTVWRHPGGTSLRVLTTRQDLCLRN